MRRNGLDVSGNPLMLWADFAWKSCEMLLASAQVIQHRARRIAVAGPNPSARDRREFRLMEAEKVDAASKSAAAMSKSLISMDPLLGVKMTQQMLAATTAVMSLAASRSPSRYFARHMKMASVLGQLAQSMANANTAAVRFHRAGLAPVRSRAISNARRLGK